MWGVYRSGEFLQSYGSGSGENGEGMRRVLVVTQICELWMEWFEEHAWECVAAVWVRNEHELAFALAIDREYEVVRLDVTVQ